MIAFFSMPDKQHYLSKTFLISSGHVVLPVSCSSEFLKDGLSFGELHVGASIDCGGSRIGASVDVLQKEVFVLEDEGVSPPQTYNSFRQLHLLHPAAENPRSLFPGLVQRDEAARGKVLWDIRVFQASVHAFGARNGEVGDDQGLR